MKNTRVSSIVCFTILVLPVLLDEEYRSFQYRVFYNTSITSIVGWRILELPEVGITGHNFEWGPSKDHSNKVWLQLVQWFLRRRLKCEMLTDGRRTTDEKWWQIKKRWPLFKLSFHTSVFQNSRYMIIQKPFKLFQNRPIYWRNQQQSFISDTLKCPQYFFFFF